MSENTTHIPSDRQIAIVNTNWNVNNIVDLNDPELKERVLTTLTTCSELLQSHCGPLSGYAMLVNNGALGESQSPSLFTRDGIRIMSNVEFMSPLERYFKNLLVYIGTRVDAAAKDGTTTSMLWSCELLKKIVEEHSTNTIGELTIYHVNHIVDKVFNDVLNNLRKNSLFTTDEVMKQLSIDEMQCASKIAFIQALSSSGGNLELASAMRDIFAYSPRNTWDYISFSYAGRECPKQFYIREDEYDYRIGCVNMTDDTLNSYMNTEYIAEDVLCLVLQNGAAQGSIEFIALKTKLEAIDGMLKDVSGQTNTLSNSIAIVTPYLDAYLINKINDINQLLRDRKATERITVWQYSAYESINGKAFNWVLQIVNAIAGCTPFTNDSGYEIDVHRHMFHATKVHWRNKYLELYGIIPGEVNNATRRHPYYEHPETATPVYKDMLASATRLLDEARHAHDDNTANVALYTDVLNNLTTIRRPSLQLGGTTHDQTANTEVVRDVLGSIMSSLTHGFLINGPLSLYQAISDTLYQYRTSAYDRTKKIEVAQHKLALTVLMHMQSSLTTVINTVYGKNFANNYNPESFEKTVYRNSLTSDDYDSEGINLYSYLNNIPSSESKLEDLSLDNCNFLATCYPISQPIKIAEEMVKRAHELIIKFMMTNKIVVNGGVIVDKENK